jgi:hypothetical protein
VPCPPLQRFYHSGRRLEIHVGYPKRNKAVRLASLGGKVMLERIRARSVYQFIKVMQLFFTFL